MGWLCLPTVIKDYHNTSRLYSRGSLEPLSELLIRRRKEWWRIRICSTVCFWWICYARLTSGMTAILREKELKNQTLTHTHILVDRQLTDTEVWCVNGAIFRLMLKLLILTCSLDKNWQGNCSVQIPQVWKQPTFYHILFHASLWELLHFSIGLGCLSLYLNLSYCSYAEWNFKFSIQRTLTANK